MARLSPALVYLLCIMVLPFIGCGRAVDTVPPALQSPQINATFVINLDRSPERLNYMAHQLGKAGIPFTRMKAIDGKKDIDFDRLYETGICSYRPSEHRKLTPGEVGNYLSHQNAWLKITEENLSAALVLEDDTIINPTFRGKLDEVLKFVPGDWDILYLGCRAKEWGGCNATFHDTSKDAKFVIMDQHCTAGNYAYVVNSKGATKLLAHSKPAIYPTDQFIRFRMLGGNASDFRAYCANPELVEPNYDLGSIITEYGR